MTGIRLENIAKTYGTGTAAAAAVRDVSLSVDSGEFFFLLGPSGCGKTTLLRIIAGLIEPTGGRVYFGPRDVTALSVEKRRSAMVFQNYALWPHMSVEQNVEFGPKMRGRGRAARRQIAGENLARVEMEAFARRRPNQLSGGQQQRVALARALAARGERLLLDEPLSNLDARLRLHMRGELRRLVKQTGITTVYVTHDQKEALSMADRIAVMDQGRIVQIGPPEAIYNHPVNRFVADFLGEANFVQGRVEPVGGGWGVRTSVGLLPLAAAAASASAGVAVTCCIRPERIRLAAVGAPEAAATGTAAASPGTVPAAAPQAPLALPATVVSVTYLGEIRQYGCQLAQGVQWRVSQLADGRQPYAAGQAVQLRFGPDDLALLQDSAG